MKMKPIAHFFNLLASFIASITGRISWSCPPWLIHLRERVKAQPGLYWGGIIGLVLLIGGTLYGYRWYQNLPRPKLITAQITVPKISPLDQVEEEDQSEDLLLNPLTIDFGLENNGFTKFAENSFTKQSVAPLQMVEKDVKEGITITPKIPGHWYWQSDSQLVFTPEQQWPAGQTYTVSFAKNVFSSHTKMASLNYSFSTLPFEATIAEFKFYQHPDNAQLREAVATINFNYPVDTASFESKTTLMLQALKNDKFNLKPQHFKFTVNYDKLKRTAYLHSEALPLPEVERFLELTIDEGVAPLSGPSKTTEEVTKKVLIPDAGSYFKVSNATATIVRNDQDRPGQVLTVETTLGVKESELKPALHVYLLPQDYPATAAEEAKKDYAWQNPGEVTADILKLATPLDLQDIPADRDYATLHSYKFTAQTPRYIYLKIDKGVRGFGDFVLSEDYNAVIEVPAYPKEIGFLHKGALLALTGEKKLSVTVRGLPAVKFEIARVLPDDVNQLVTQANGSFNNPTFINQSFNQQNISEIFSDIRQFDNSDLAKEQYTALDLGKYLANKNNPDGPLGLFLLQARGWDVEKKIPLDVQSSRLILITDLGLVVKDNIDGTHDVFVESITKGEPQADVKVAILGKNGLPILTRTTDAQGRASFPSLKDFIEEREPTVYLASLKNDVSFIPYNNADRQLNYSKFDVGGQYINPELQSLRAFVFSDRGIYRPGDTAHIGMIVKQAYVQPQPAGLPLEATVTDPRGVTIQRQRFVLDATGYLSLDVPTNTVSPTGQYSINLYIVKDNQASSMLGSTTIRVAEFLPDRMRISAHLSQETPKGWISPASLTAKVGLWNLYGAPATDRKISAKILLAPQRVNFKEYPGYIFVDPLFDPKKPAKVFTDTLTDAQTNNEGEANFKLNLERFDKATYQLTFFAEGFESEGGRSVATQTTALVSPLTYLIGYKPDGDLNYIKQHGQRAVNLIAVNPQLNLQPVSNLKIQLISLHPVTTLVKKPDGTYQYQSLIQTTVVSTNPLSLSEEGMNYSLPTDQIGDFAVAIVDKDNIELSRFKFSVVGASQLPLAKNAELSVKLNKPEYQADENIELQITAPYTGSGLITIERDKVYATQWFKTNTTNSVQTIHIPKDFKGNGYVNVAFVRDWDSPEIFVSPLSYSVVPFTVSHSEHAINIDLNTPALARPGEPFAITYKSDKPGKIIVYAVDEGILQVGNYQTPDPLAFFFDKNALEVITQQTVDQILPKFIADRELSVVGGDGGEAALRSNLNPFKRKTDLPVVYWSGIVDTDNTPRQLVYNIPDYFNGTLRVMAVAVGIEAIGATSKSTEVRGNFVINPNVPTFVAPGDEFEITASVANNVQNSGKNAAVTLQLKVSPELEIIGSDKLSLVIDEKQEKTARFKLRAKSILGSATITLTASSGDKSSKMAATLSVRPVMPYFTTVLSGTSNDASKVLTLDRALYPEYRAVEAAISTSPLILVAGLQRYLDNFPYGCTEQLVSKALPLLAMANQAWFAKDTRIITEKVDATIQMIGQRQMSSGAISYWPGIGDNASNTFATVYAMHFLTEAKRQGYDVPSDLMHAGLGYLKELAAQDVTSLEQARIQAYAIYILTRNELVTTNYLTNLQLYLDKDKSHAWQQDITSAYMASTYQLLKSYNDADRLIKYYQPDHKATATNDFYNNYIADAQYLYLLARHFPDQLQRLGDGLVMPLVTAMNSDAINTVLSGYTSLALSAYGQSYQIGNGATFSVSETLKGGKQQSLAAPDSSYQKVNLDELAQKVTFGNPNKIRYFYQLTQAGFDKKLPSSSIKQGLEVYREYREVQGKSIAQASLGREIEVHIRVRALSDRYLSNIAIVDLLPGGFEVVRDSINLENLNAVGIDYADVREDRVIFFGGISEDAKEIVYRIKATNQGDYTIPPIMADSMYDPAIRALSEGGSIKVTS